MNEVDKCPKCGGELEGGFIHAPRGGIRWDTKEHKLHVYFLEELLPMRYWTLASPRVTSLRCKKCRLVLFHY
jgi:hypothetical protein